MNLGCRLFTLPKAGNTTNENEDSFACDVEATRRCLHVLDCQTADLCVIANRPVRIAVTDGATESSFSDVWAKLIARAFCRPTDLGPRPSHSDGDDIEILRRQSAGLFDHAARVWNHRLRNRRLPWYAEQKKEMGAFTAFIGLRVCPARAPQQHGTWEALAAGDACLFHFRSGSLRRAFPIEHHESFSNNPYLLSSKGPMESSLVSASGEWQPGDEFALATDALACWILHVVSLGEDVAALLRNLCSQDDFAVWADQQRHADGHLPSLRNDDVTLAWCCIDPETDQPPAI